MLQFWGSYETKNVKFMIGLRFYYAITYFFPLLKKLDILNFFKNRGQHLSVCPKMTISNRYLLDTY